MRFALEIPQKDTNFSNVAPHPVSNGTALYISKKIRFLDKTRFPLSAVLSVDILTKLLANNALKAMKQQKLESYFGRRIAIDAGMSIYQFFGTQMLTNEASEVSKYSAIMFYRTIRLSEAGIMPVYAIASEDMDFLTVGAPIFLRHLIDPSSRKLPVMEFEISKILEEMNLDMDQFTGPCILSGYDYSGMEIFDQKFGTERSFATNRFGLTISALAMLLHVYQIPDNWPYSKVQLLFKEPIVSMEDQPEIKWTAPNKGLISFLVNENGFNIDRVMKLLFFKPAKGLSVPAKRKGSKCTLRSPNLAFKHKTFSTQVSVNLHPRFLGNFRMPTMVLGMWNFKQPLRVVCLLIRS
ncbi:hypothetical protein BT93_L3499 [Corymbia citriodora subsp. variegata]|uniref:Uncharacterized protein n=1 Tax=Corymbia citriodora subsp. variegata TaxID=360336 RepID=A0A8T0CVH4_CORYI|nr:hypothetical protein BT93_L3499 [Corymbia citriodora subsp. variegata]